MTMKNVLGSADLSADPFRIVPPDDFENLIWAGDRSTYEELMEACSAPRPDEIGTSEFVILWGDLGSGKTHHLKYAARDLRSDDQLVAFLVRPNVTSNTQWKDIVQEIVAQFSRQEIVTRFDKLRRYILTTAPRQAEEEMEGSVDPDRLARLTKEKQISLYSSLLPACPGFVEFMMDLSAQDNGKRDECWSFLTAILAPAKSQAIASKYSIPSTGMGTDHDASQILYYLIKLLTTETDQGVGSEAVYILIDECENINDFTPANRQSVQQGLREFVNYVTEHTMLALALTCSDASDIYGNLDEPVVARISRSLIRVPQIDEQDAKGFLLEELSLFRTADSDKTPEWPFTEDGLDAFVQECERPLTFRRLNRSARNMIFSTYKQKVMDGLGIDAVDVSNFRGWGL